MVLVILKNVYHDLQYHFLRFKRLNTTVPSLQSTSYDDVIPVLLKENTEIMRDTIKPESEE